MPHDDFKVEPIPGLPAMLPPGEEILVQTKPDWWALSKDALGVWWVAGYFAALGLWRCLTVIDIAPLSTALAAMIPWLIAGVVACGLLMFFAWVQAHYTIYTITSSRIVMRIGAALTITLNLPYTQLANASLDLRKSGHGTIAFETMGETRLSYLACWPNVRPWYMRRPQPALRCIPDAERVAEMISEAAEARLNMPVIQRDPGVQPVPAE